MDYTIEAIETMYEGTLFRSRLEAQWAAFFDQAGWKWKYEPFDCAGWIPDFGIEAAGAPHDLLLVEVKPVTTFQQDVANKIDRANTGHEVIILGVGPLYNSWQMQAGWLREYHGEKEAASWEKGFFGKWNDRVGIRAEYGSWHDRISNTYNGNAGAEAPCGEVQAWWREAGNQVRWEKK